MVLVRITFSVVAGRKEVEVIAKVEDSVTLVADWIKKRDHRSPFRRPR